MLHLNPLLNSWCIWKTYRKRAEHLLNLGRYDLVGCDLYTEN